MRATGSFDVTLQPLEACAEGKANTTRGRMSIDKTFRGELEANSQGEMLTAMPLVEGSAG